MSLFKFALLTAVGASPAKDALSQLFVPSDVAATVAFIEERVANASPKVEGVPRILIAGDSWADVVGIGGNEGFLGKVLQKHECAVAAPTCIAIPGSTTGTSRDNTVCSWFTPITWQVDRKCHVVSAASFDKMCAMMLEQGDDMHADLHAHGARLLVADKLSTDTVHRKSQ